MTMAADEARTIRSRLERLEQALDRLDRTIISATHTVALVTATESTYPLSARRFYACHTESVGGTEAEGTTPTLTAGTSFVYALNVGTKIPPAGTHVVGGFSQGRLIFQYDGAES